MPHLKLESGELLRELPFLRYEPVEDSTTPLFKLPGGAQLIVGSLVVLSEPGQSAERVLMPHLP